ncbi:hypothetical protein [Rhizobium leucaenae]|uniref:hypothetical protein n=1 Tax=Rhizobium leucaenae TaxID=29450 RepID=UPI0016163040|nr:hypothetical protein [Rhizobium leucaenae]MBB6299935.1 hypothetical protein [Rhizobium leucaenae]
MSTFNPLELSGSTPIATIGHNQPPFEAISQEINDLFEEAKHWADGEPITSPEMHDAIEKLRDGIHEAGKRADALRVEEKRPLDEQVKAIQDRYNVYIQPKRGKVDLAKSTLDTLLTPWRTKVAQEKAAEAARVAAAAEAARVAATEAIRASSGNLAAREEAESLLQDAKRLEKTATRTFKAATTGTGLRTTYRADLVDINEALDHYWGSHQGAFEDLVRELAASDVRFGVRKIPGFSVVEEKRAA